MRTQSSKTCIVCSSKRNLKEISNRPKEKLTDQSRIATCDLTLYNVASLKNPARNLHVRILPVIYIFLSSTKSTSGKFRAFYLCSFHLNNNRYPQRAAIARDQNRKESPYRYCVLFGSECMEAGSLLRPVPTFSHKEEDLNTIEQLIQLSELVEERINAVLHGQNVQGKYACTQFLYVVSCGRDGSASFADVATLEHKVDRWLVPCILYAMKRSSTIQKILPVQDRGLSFACDAAHMLNSAMLKVSETIPILRLFDVLKCRQPLLLCFE